MKKYSDLDWQCERNLSPPVSKPEASVPRNKKKRLVLDSGEKNDGSVLIRLYCVNIRSALTGYMFISSSDSLYTVIPSFEDFLSYSQSWMLSAMEEKNLKVRSRCVSEKN